MTVAAAVERVVHIRVRFPGYTDLAFDYWARESAAVAFAEAVATRLQVRIDNLLSAAKAPLPCADLWP